MTTGALGIVEAWPLAVNGASVADAVALTAEQAEVLGPRGERLVPRQELRGLDGAVWIHGHTPRWFCGGKGTVVVGQDARWIDRETGQERDRALIASHFKVDDGFVTRIAPTRRRTPGCTGLGGPQ